MMSFISYFINGLSLGSVYAIIALGYTMVYGIAKMLNFAHGDVIMIGGYVVFTVVSTMGLGPVAGILLAVILCTVLGVVIEGVAYRPLRMASPLAVLITAIGVSYLLQNIALLVFGSNPKSFTSVVTVPALKLAQGKLIISGETIVTIISCIIIMIGLTLFIRKTRAGQAMLAVSEDKGAAQLMELMWTEPSPLLLPSALPWLLLRERFFVPLIRPLPLIPAPCQALRHSWLLYLAGLAPFQER